MKHGRTLVVGVLSILAGGLCAMPPEADAFLAELEALRSQVPPYRCDVQVETLLSDREDRSMMKSRIQLQGQSIRVGDLFRAGEFTRTVGPADGDTVTEVQKNHVFASADTVAWHPALDTDAGKPTGPLDVYYFAEPTAASQATAVEIPLETKRAQLGMYSFDPMESFLSYDGGTGGYRALFEEMLANGMTTRIEVDAESGAKRLVIVESETGMAKAMLEDLVTESGREIRMRRYDRHGYPAQDDSMTLVSLKDGGLFPESVTQRRYVANLSEGCVQLTSITDAHACYTGPASADDMDDALAAATGRTAKQMAAAGN